MSIALHPLAVSAPASLAASYDTVRHAAQSTVCPSGHRGLCRSVDARRQPGEVAPGAHRPGSSRRSSSPPMHRAIGRFTPQFDFLFNSYYNAVGTALAAAAAGPAVPAHGAEVFAYRAHVDRRLAEPLRRAAPDDPGAVPRSLVLGLHHEQQHQELLLTDLKHAFCRQSAAPRSTEQAPGRPPPPAPPGTWLSFPEGSSRIGQTATASPSTTNRPGIASP